MHSKVVIIGSGPAGYTAAIYAARAMLEPVMVAGTQPGGQLTITTDVENYPGFADVIQGPWLMDQMKAQAEHVGTEFVNDIVLSADLSKRPFHIKTDSGQEWLAETVIIATGAQELITANIGCSMQIARHLQEAGRDIPVRHVVEILAEAID